MTGDWRWRQDTNEGRRPLVLLRPPPALLVRVGGGPDDRRVGGRPRPESRQSEPVPDGRGDAHEAGPGATRHGGVRETPSGAPVGVALRGRPGSVLGVVLRVGPAQAVEGRGPPRPRVALVALAAPRAAEVVGEVGGLRPRGVVGGLRVGRSAEVTGVVGLVRPVVALVLAIG